jgi:hypothetical protein
MGDAKCQKCKHKGRPKHVFPCSKCIQENLKERPLDCTDCRTYWFGECKKGLRPCKNFEWS